MEMMPSPSPPREPSNKSLPGEKENEDISKNLDSYAVKLVPSDGLISRYYSRISHKWFSSRDDHGFTNRHYHRIQNRNNQWIHCRNDYWFQSRFPIAERSVV